MNQLKKKESILEIQLLILFQKEFTIVGFTKDQMFSHTPVVYVNEDVWGAITQPNQKIIVQLHLTQIKRLKMHT